MDTNFFKQIEALNLTGDLNITIAKGAEQGLVVSVFLQNDQCGDNAKKLIPPYTLKGTATELDEGFIAKVTTPLQTASGLMVDMEAYMKQLEEVKKQSAIEKDKESKIKKEKDAKDKRYKDAMQKVDELDKAGKFRDAWMKVPHTSEFPDHAETIRKRKASLSQKFSPDLFEAAGDNTPPAKETTEPQTPNEDYPEEWDNDNDLEEDEELHDEQQ
ncbi:PRTRC system protein E [Niabella sp. CJ426]|uniref:PRTRC system protein E n=1 Tax=Niabella sp. CJ426 TaxID=3393740 RepID=UPI003CFD3EAE